MGGTKAVHHPTWFNDESSMMKKLLPVLLLATSCSFSPYIDGCINQFWGEGAEICDEVGDDYITPEFMKEVFSVTDRELLSVQPEYDTTIPLLSSILSENDIPIIFSKRQLYDRCEHVRDDIFSCGSVGGFYDTEYDYIVVSKSPCNSAGSILTHEMLHAVEYNVTGKPAVEHGSPFFFGEFYGADSVESKIWEDIVGYCNDLD